MAHNVLILGVSTRAAAMTALRGGLKPYCVDRFADQDLAAVCPVERVEAGKDLRGLVDAAERLTPSSWFYTGGLENDPDLVDRVSRRHDLWGMGGAALRRIRDPIAVAGILSEAGIPAPEARLDPSRLARDGSWLVKPRASGGGRGIEPLEGRTGPGSSPVYFQRRIHGPSFSALFIGRAGSARLVGIARQWIGIPGQPFVYRGSLGPCPIGPELAHRLGALGDRLAAAFGLLGWFGVDYVLEDGIPWPVEVNPRYTASIEIHELASGRSLLEDHRAAWQGDAEAVPVRVAPPPDPSRVVAKRIVYAPGRIVVPEGIIPEGVGDRFDVPPIADVPAPGTIIEAGEPVLTVFASGENAATCLARVIKRERGWGRRLGFVMESRR